MDTKELIPGKKLDALIAEKVMGPEKGGASFLEFSIDIRAAFMIVEKLREQKKALILSQVYHQVKDPFWEYLAKIEWTDQRLGYQFVFAAHESAPMAICLAAIQTIKK